MVKKKIAILGEIDDIRSCLLMFSMRYQHYYSNCTATYWKCNIVENHPKLIFQLVDLSFEPPRGRNVRSDAPYIEVNFEKGKGVTYINYSLYWQKWKTALTFSTIFVLIILFIAPIIQAQVRRILTLPAFLIMSCLPVLFMVWIIQNIRHDLATIQVFQDLISKNLQVVQM